MRFLTLEKRIPCLQADRDAAKTTFDSFVHRRGAFAHLDYPPFSAEKKDVLMFFRSGQPSHLLKALGEHCATLSGSQGLSERSWARLSRQCTPLRNSLLASTKQTLMNLATNWPCIYPSVHCQWKRQQLRRRRKRYDVDFVCPDRPAGRRDAGPAAEPVAPVPRAGPNEDLSSESGTSSSDSESSSQSDVALDFEEDKD